MSYKGLARRPLFLMPNNIKSGQSRAVTEGWIAMAREAMVQKGWNQAELARKAKETESTITRLLEGNATRAAARIAETLGIPNPYLMVNGPDDYLWYELGQSLQQLAPEAFQALIAQAEQILKLAQKVTEADQVVAETIDSE